MSNLAAAGTCAAGPAARARRGRRQPALGYPACMDASAAPAGPAPDWRAPAAAGPCDGVLALPGSKSMTNRALVLAALASGPTLITGPLAARDTLLMTAALGELGAIIEPDSPPGPGGFPGPGSPPGAACQPGRDNTGPGASTAAHGGRPVLRVTPAVLAGPPSPRRTAAVDVGNAGTVLRFVPPAAALTTADVRFSGDARAAQRPVGPLLDGLRQLGAVIDDGDGRVMFTVRGRGGLPGGSVTLDASASSQLVSGLMLASPRYDKGVEIRHEGPPVPSAPHLAMTVAMLRAAGAQVSEDAREAPGPGGRPGVPDIWRVHPGSLDPRAIDIEPDLSNAAPFLAAALVTGGSITISGWPRASLQPAGQILAVLTEMGARCELGPAGLTVTGSGTIRGTCADLRDISELSPVLTAVAALASSPSEFTGIGHQRNQECDRLAALAAEIGALGGAVTELTDGLAIVPRPLQAGPAAFASHDDHRLVMAAAVLGLVVPGLRVANAATVGKTFPGFLRLWEQLVGGPS